MYLQYGSYQHSPGEVELVRITRQTVLSPRNRNIYRKDTWLIRGEVKADPSLTDPGDIQDDITTKLIALEVAYANDGEDLKFIQDTSPVSNSAHVLISSNTFGGTRVEMRPSYPVGAPCEYANKRNYQIVVSGLVFEVESQIFSWEESFIFTGNCGPERRWIKYLDIPNQQYQVWPATPQEIIQTGSGIGVDGYVTFGPAFFTGSNLFEHQDRRRVKFGTPRSYRNSYAFYPASWTYVYEARVAQAGVPTPV